MNWKLCLAVLTCNVLFMSSSYTMIIPFLPVYLTKELGVIPADIHLWSGIIFSASFIVSSVMAPIWGRMADNRGKRLMALRASFLLSISYFLGGVVSTPIQLACVRLFQGFASGLWPMTLAIMTSYAPTEKTGFCLGIMQGALTAGSVIGPLFGGVLSEVFGMRASFFIATGALFFNFIMLLVVIKEPPHTPPSPEEKQPSFSVLKSPIIRDMLLFAVLVQMVIFLVQPIMAPYIEELTGTSDSIAMKAGIIFSLSGIAGAVTAPLWGRFGQKHGFYTSLIYALTLAGINPSINAILANATTNNVKGRVFGLLFSAQQTGAFIGPLAGAAIATVMGMHSIFIVAGAVLLLISLLVRKHRPKPL